MVAAGRADRIALVLGQGEHLPFPDATFDALTFTYLLRYVADPAATIAELAAGRAPRRDDGQPRVRRAAQPLLARLVVALHPRRAPRRRGRAWRAGVVRRRSLPRAQHLRPLPALPSRRHRRRVGSAGLIDIGVRRMSLGGGLVMWGRRRAGRPERTGPVEP